MLRPHLCTASLHYVLFALPTFTSRRLSGAISFIAQGARPRRMEMVSIESLNSAVASSRRDDPQRLLQAIDGVRNGATVGIGYHVPGIIHEVQI